MSNFCVQYHDRLLSSSKRVNISLEKDLQPGGKTTDDPSQAFVMADLAAFCARSRIEKGQQDAICAEIMARIFKCRPTSHILSQ